MNREVGARYLPPRSLGQVVLLYRDLGSGGGGIASRAGTGALTLTVPGAAALRTARCRHLELRYQALLRAARGAEVAAQPFLHQELWSQVPGTRPLHAAPL